MSTFLYDGDLDSVRDIEYPIAAAFTRNFTYGALEAFSGATYLSRPIAPGSGTTAPATATHPVVAGAAPNINHRNTTEGVTA